MSISKLPNIGNTCYLNASLQGLFSTSAFRSFVSTSVDNVAKCVDSIYNDPQNYSTLVTQLQKLVGKKIDLFEQNDAMEFLTLLVDDLHTECTKDYVDSNLSIDNTVPKIAIKMKKAWKELKANHVRDIFYGQVVVQVHCNQCLKNQHQSEIFTQIDMCIPDNPNDILTLKSLLNMSFECADIHMRECDFCHCKCPGKRSQRIWNLPDVLMLHVKRYNQIGIKKIQHITAEQVLDVSEYCIGKTQPLYQLKSIICHTGSLSFGHYYCIICCQDKWVILDDDSSPRVIEDISAYSRMFQVFIYEKLT
jgi:ubiquitin C-terminal hydrolase